MSHNIHNPVVLFNSENDVEYSDVLFKKLGKKCLVVTGKNSAKKSGALDDVTRVFNRCGITFEVFDSVTENPKTETCFEAGEKARKMNADFILGIGGGSPLDAAKAIAVYAANPQISSPDLIYTEPVTNEPLPVVLIGTSAGTGSEVTCVSVLTNTKGKKKSVKGKNYYAKYAIANAKYTYSLPYSVTVSTALDALCHSVESLLSSRADERSEYYARIAIMLIWNELAKLEKTKELPDKETRDRLYEGSIYAGEAIDITGCCFPHSVGYYLTEKHGIPHGKACAVFLPEYVRRGIEFKPDAAKDFLNFIGVDFAEFERVILSLADVHIDLDENDLESYLVNWQSVANFDSSPGGFDKEKAKQLVLKLKNS